MTWSKRLFAAFSIVLLALFCFLFGFDVCLHLKTSSSAELRTLHLRQPGDAPPHVRAGVLKSLRDFHDGYQKHDAKLLNSFMERLFPRNGDILLLGTDADEWARGYPAISEFIGNDWAYWGKFEFDVENSIVSSIGDVAWITSVGVVRFPRSERPVRFSAILNRTGDKWLFRQVQFQWDERDPVSSELWRASTHKRIAQLMIDQTKRARQTATRTLVGLVARD